MQNPAGTNSVGRLAAGHNDKTKALAKIAVTFCPNVALPATCQPGGKRFAIGAPLVSRLRNQGKKNIARRAPRFWKRSDLRSLVHRRPPSRGKPPDWFFAPATAHCNVGDRWAITRVEGRGGCARTGGGHTRSPQLYWTARPDEHYRRDLKIHTRVETENRAYPPGIPLYARSNRIPMGAQYEQTQIGSLTKTPPSKI